MVFVWCWSGYQHQCDLCILYVGSQWDSWTRGCRSGCPLLWGCPAGHQKEDGPDRPWGWDHWCWSHELTCCHYGWLQGKASEMFFFAMFAHYGPLSPYWNDCLSFSGLWARATHLHWGKQLLRFPTSPGRTSEVWMMSRGSCRSWCR